MTEGKFVELERIYWKGQSLRQRIFNCQDKIENAKIRLKDEYLSVCDRSDYEHIISVQSKKREELKAEFREIPDFNI